MPQPSWAGIITAVAGIITSLALVLAALPALIKVLRSTAANTLAVQTNTRAVAQVHQIVNQSATDSRNYQAALIRALAAAGVDIPIDQSLTSPPEIPPPTPPAGHRADA